MTEEVVSMTAQQSPPGPVRAHSPLAESIIALAQTPDDACTLDAQLVTIAQLAADRVAAVSYASVTALRAGGYTTVAASGEIARAVDEAQYAEQGGPCIETVENAAPVAVPDITAVMLWPGFRQAAVKMGLRASLSIPLTAGSGAPGAALNLYGRDEAAMAAVTRGVYAAFGITPPPTPGPGPGMLDAGGQELIAGVTQALAVRATIEQAIGVTMSAQGCMAGEAYLQLRVRAAETGASLHDTARTVINKAG
jgi:hypothetical protein